VRANQDGKTVTPWSESSVQRVARYLTSYCAEFGLLEGGIRKVRKILPYRIDPHVSAILAYDLHFKEHGDNSVLSHPDWGLFGLAREDVLDEMKRLALKGLLIVQAAGGVTRISWLHKSMEEVADVLARS
ncbi:MAG: BrxA family protein, partial [Anaerolineae bacterium]